MEKLLLKSGEIAAEFLCSDIIAPNSIVRSVFCSNLVFVRPVRGTVSESVPQRCLHIFGEVLVPGQGLSATGHLCHGDGRVSTVLCHVTQGLGDLNSVGFSEWKHHVQLHWVLPLLPNAPLSPSFAGILFAICGEWATLQLL